VKKKEAEDGDIYYLGARSLGAAYVFKEEFNSHDFIKNNKKIRSKNK
jgi:hypothetical protein